MSKIPSAPTTTTPDDQFDVDDASLDRAMLAQHHRLLGPVLAATGNQPGPLNGHVLVTRAELDAALLRLSGAQRAEYTAAIAALRADRARRSRTLAQRVRDAIRGFIDPQPPVEVDRV